MQTRGWQTNRMALALALAMTTCGFAVQTAAADLSSVSDFGADRYTSNEAFITQIGDGNFASIDQVVDVYRGGGNFAEINQSNSSGNLATIVQTGESNRIRIDQSGSDFNTANVTQNGVNNTLDLTQQGGGNQFTSNQTGNGNLIVFAQNGGNTANLNEIGNNNTINLSQPRGSLAVTNITLTGNGMTATVK